jgi:hypothetical protein
MHNSCETRCLFTFYLYLRLDLTRYAVDYFLKHFFYHFISRPLSDGRLLNYHGERGDRVHVDSLKGLARCSKNDRLETAPV